MLGDEWIIKSAGGSTGEAYLAYSDDKRLFLKRNSSPFLAVLSAQGIVPKLVWTKRLENGDVITAQQWLDGKELKPEVLQHPKVAELLGRIHHSTELLDMLTRMGKEPLNPAQQFDRLLNDLRSEHTVLPLVGKRALNFMQASLHEVTNFKPAVCHGDLNHNNWLFTNDGQLYLIDWDNAEIGDPAIDLAMMFNHYIPNDEWTNWLAYYGIESSQSLYLRMYWYIIYEALIKINRIQSAAALADKIEALQMIVRQAERYL
nr:phosphotransferase family protein [Amphibacillus marinus]